MRKLDKFIIWPIYFDQGKTRKEGRRVEKSKAVQSPKIIEVKEAADRLGLQNEINLEAHFPKTPWLKNGMLLIEKRESKENTIQKLSEQIKIIKSRQLQTNKR